jgi:hypothetical protein
MGETTIKSTILEHEPRMRLVECGVMPSCIAHITFAFTGTVKMQAIWHV